MRGLKLAATAIFELLGVEPGPWTGPVVALVLFLLLLPLMLRNIRTSRARKLLEEAALQPGPRGRALEWRALEAVGRHAPGLVVVCEEALRRGRTELAQEAFRRLVETGRRRRDARRLWRRLRDEPPPTPEALVIAVEHLLEAGLYEEAARRLRTGRGRWPDHPELLDLERRLAERRGLPPAPPG